MCWKRGKKTICSTIWEWNLTCLMQLGIYNKLSRWALYCCCRNGRRRLHVIFLSAWQIQLTCAASRPFLQAFFVAMLSFTQIVLQVGKSTLWANSNRVQIPWIMCTTTTWEVACLNISFKASLQFRIETTGMSKHITTKYFATNQIKW